MGDQLRREGNPREIWGCTIKQLLDAESFDMPPTNITLTQAQRVQPEANQGELLCDSFSAQGQMEEHLKRIQPLSAMVALLLCSCQSLSAALYPTRMPQPTHTPYPTYTPAQSPSPTTDCVALAAFLTAMDTPAADYDRHLGQWNRWMKHVYEESVSSEAILDRLAEFWSDLGEIRDQVSKIRPPRDARNIHELFLKMMVEEKRAIELLQGYYTTHNESHRSDANAALAQNGVLRREYDKQLTDLWESCFGVPLGEAKYP